MQRKVDHRNYDTKITIVDSFKNLCISKEINKITISDITNYCKLNRNTFYYHFKDVYDLIEWILKSEITNVLTSVDINNIEKLLNTVFDYVDDNRKFLKSVYKAFDRDNLRKLLYPYFYGTLNNIVEEYGIDKILNDEGFKTFAINFYTDGIAQSIVNYIQDDKINKNQIINYLLTLNNNLYSMIKIDNDV